MPLEQTPIQNPLKLGELETSEPSPKLDFNGDPKKVVSLIPREYAVLKPGKDKTVAYACLDLALALVLHDPENHVAALAHFDAGTKIQESIPPLLEDLQKAGGQQFKARLFGDYPELPEQSQALIKMLQKEGIPIVEADQLQPTSPSLRYIGVSAQGELYTSPFWDMSIQTLRRLEALGKLIRDNIETPLQRLYPA